MSFLLLPRLHRPVLLDSMMKRLDELQLELEKRVERLEGTKTKLISHANGALSAAAHAAHSEIVNKEGS